MLARLAILCFGANGHKTLYNIRFVNGSSYALVSRKF